MPVLNVDYLHGGALMNNEGWFVYATAARSDFCVQAEAGLSGDFILRYQQAALVRLVVLSFPEFEPVEEIKR